MYGPRANEWKMLSVVFIMGLIMMAIIWIAGPPALLTLFAWLLAPRMGWDHFNYLHFYGVSVGVWLGLHIASVALASWPLWKWWKR